MLMTSMVLKEEPQDFICHCIKALSGEIDHAHIKAAAADLTGDDVTSTKCLLNPQKGCCKLRSNERVAAIACKQPVQGDLGLLEYIEKCKEVTAA